MSRGLEQRVKAINTYVGDIYGRREILRAGVVPEDLGVDAYWFSRLGVYMERADNTARILDVKYHLLLPANERVGGPLDYFQWAAICGRCRR